MPLASNKSRAPRAGMKTLSDGQRNLLSSLLFPKASGSEGRKDNILYKPQGLEEEQHA